jgi:hypothetical protein
MCLSRMTSDSFILDGGCRNHLVAKISAEVPGGPQVDLATQLFRQFQFHARDVEKIDLTPGSNSTKTSMSLSGRKRGVRTEPKRDSLRM